MEDRPSLEVDGIEKAFDDGGRPFQAVDGVSFQIQPGQFYTLLGPSGCGKTTTMRCVAGLERPDSGTVSIEGVLVSASNRFVPANKRDIGMVFQSYAIWPHMSVFENVAFPLRVAKRRSGRSEIRDRVMNALEMVQLGGLEQRNATQLSGGQQQRLALARALVRQPKLLLLDEPLSNLDAKLRERMRTDVRNLQRRLGIAALYVTHDQAEALSMSDRIAVMQNGRLMQEGTPREIYQRPASRFVADFVGSSNFIEGTVKSAGPAGVSLACPMGTLTAPAQPDGLDEGASVVVFIRPENLRVHVKSVEADNVFEGTVEETTFLGEHLHCRVVARDQRLFIRQHPAASLQTGDRVFVELPAEDLALITDGTVDRMRAEPIAQTEG